MKISSLVLSASPLTTVPAAAHESMLPPATSDLAQQIPRTETESAAPGALVDGDREYIDQKALHLVGSAYAYARSSGTVQIGEGLGLSGFAVVSGQPNLGKGSHINIISGLRANSFAPTESIDLSYPEFSQAPHRVRVRVTVGSDTDTIDVLCA